MKENFDTSDNNNSIVPCVAQVDSSNSIEQGCLIKDKDGDIGMVINCEDLHNIEVWYLKGGKGLYCQVQGCEQYEAISRIELENPEVSDTTTDDSSTNAGNKKLQAIVSKIDDLRTRQITDADDEAYDRHLYEMQMDIFKVMDELEANTKTPSIYPRWVRAVDRHPLDSDLKNAKTDTKRLVVFYENGEWYHQNTDKVLPWELKKLYWLDENPDPVEVKSDAVQNKQSK